MATYPVVNRETGEQKEVVMSVDDWEKWKSDNPMWIRDWSDPSTAPNSCEVGEWRDKLIKKHPGWNDILQKSGKTAGYRNQVKKI